MNIDQRLFVEIVPLETPNAPHPHPIRDGGFDPAYIYKVVGMYNASETSECFMILVNPERQIWFIPQRHLRAWRLIESDQFFLPKEEAPRANNANGNGRHLETPISPRRALTDIT